MTQSYEPVRGPVVLLGLDRRASAPLHEQLELSLREHVRSGRLRPGARMPSTRTLATELGVSRGVVLEAYAQLVAEGYLAASQGAPTRVSLVPSAERPPLAASSLEPRYAYDFDPGLPDLAAFPADDWLRSLRAALREAPRSALGQGDLRGEPALRNELMAYLGRTRGAAPEPEHTLICSGFTQGFAVLCRTLRDRGLDRIAVEDPGWSKHRLIAQRAGLEPVPISVDAQGVDVSHLRSSGCEVVVLTPAHQFPTGVVLTSERRAELLEWAEDADALIVEDDYDSELRYDRDPVGALQGLAPERVCCIASVSKRLAPALSLGWMLCPSWLTGALTYEKAVADGAAPAIQQLALADFLARGELDRHLRRMRLRYRARREALLGALFSMLPQAQVSGAAAGLFVLVLLGEGVREGIVQSAAATRGVGVEGLGAHCAPLSVHRGTGLVLGYANLPERAIERGVSSLVEAIRAAEL